MLASVDPLARIGEFALVAFLGGFVGVGELVSRYRDDPAAALKTLAGITYILLNALAAAAALLLILAFDWKFGTTGKTATVTQLLVASFGSMAIFRSSLFTIRAGDSDVGIGPSSLLSAVMAACDRGVDRDRAAERASRITVIMRDVSYEKAEGPLPAVALALMQNLAAPDQAALGIQLEKLSQETMTDRAKSLLLGLAITNAVGLDVLEKAKASLGDEITGAQQPQQPQEQPPQDAAAAGAVTIPGTDAQARAGDGTTAAVPQLPQTPQTPDPADEQPPESG